MTQINGWNIFHFHLFAVQLTVLKNDVQALRVADQQGYKSHPKARLLASIFKCITQIVPAGPDHPDFRLGKTLGEKHTHWRRVKKGMPDRYRLFFRYSSQPLKTIVYVWFNDEDTLRKAGSKTDVYSVFRKMLEQGKVPGDISRLITQAVSPG